MRIAERRRSADMLHAAEAHLRTVVSNAPIVLFAVDRTGVFTLSEGHGLRALGLRPGEVVGLSVFDVYRDAPQVTENIRRALAGEEFRSTVEVEGGPGTGLVFETQYIPVRDQENQIIGIAGVATDITERRRTEQALRRSEERFRLFVEHSPAAIAMFDREMRYLVVSRRWMTDYALGDKNIVGLSHYEIFPEIPQRWKEVHQRCLAGAVEKCEEDSFPRADGRIDWVRWEIHPWHDDGGKIGGILMFTEIVTERKQAEQKVVRLNRVYAMLSGINSVILRVREWQELFDEACRLAVVAGEFHSAWIGIVDQDGRRVRPVASHEVDGEFFDQLKSLAERDAGEARGVVGRAVKEKRVVISNDIAQDLQTIRMRDAELARGIRALAVLPLIVSDEVAGVLVLYAEETGFFDAAEMDLLGEVAGDIAFGLDHIRKEERINYLAYYDSLTGLANRSLFHERLMQFIHTAQRERRKLALSVVDLDRFKDVNDALGRQKGDALLTQFAQRLTHATDDASQVARLGADHFAVVLPDIQDEGEVSRTIEGLITQCVSQPYQLADTELRISAKVGIALCPDDGLDADALFRNAEAALKKAKATGERTLFYTEQMTERVAERLALENKLRRALEREEFALYYQPKVDAKTRRIVGMEALLRWQNPDTGPVLPTKFIPVLEETGTILEVGTWVIRRAVEDQRYWAGQGIAAPRIAVNVSAVQLHQQNFVDIVHDAIGRGAGPATIDLEITESLIVQDLDVNVEKLEAIRGFGVNLAIDDFGTGYSSLAYLARLPVQLLKIDLSFIARMMNNADIMTLVSTMISLGHSLRMKVIAEGVETQEQAAALRRLGCDELQGYLISTPLPRDRMNELLLRNRPKVVPGKRKKQ